MGGGGSHKAGWDQHAVHMGGSQKHVVRGARTSDREQSHANGPETGTNPHTTTHTTTHMGTQIHTHTTTCTHTHSRRARTESQDMQQPGAVGRGGAGSRPAFQPRPDGANGSCVTAQGGLSEGQNPPSRLPAEGPPLAAGGRSWPREPSARTVPTAAQRAQGSRLNTPRWAPLMCQRFPPPPTALMGDAAVTGELVTTGEEQREGHSDSRSFQQLRPDAAG